MLHKVLKYLNCNNFKHERPAEKEEVLMVGEVGEVGEMGEVGEPA